MKRFLVLAVLVVGCGGSAGQTAASTAPVSSLPSAGSAATSGPSVAPSSAAPSASPVPSAAASHSFKAGAWPPEWQKAICAARAQMLREDAKQGGRAGEDAATQAIADLRSVQINWDPGADLRSLIGKAGFILLDAAPRPGNAMNDVPPAIKAMEAAYTDLQASTGFECPT